MPDDDDWLDLCEELADPDNGEGLVCACGDLLTSREMARVHAAHWDDPALREGWERRVREATDATIIPRATLEEMLAGLKEATTDPPAPEGECP
jgi:hypothetical protein